MYIQCEQKQIKHITRRILNLKNDMIAQFINISDCTRFNIISVIYRRAVNVPSFLLSCSNANLIKVVEGKWLLVKCLLQNRHRQHVCAVLRYRL